MQLLYTVLVLLGYARFLTWFETQSIIPLMTIRNITIPLTVRDYSNYIAALMYINILLNHIVSSSSLSDILRFWFTYANLCLMKICAMLFVPLEPPSGIIPLRDPVLEYFTGGRPMTRDLFFSGHIGTLCLCFLMSRHTTTTIIHSISIIVVSVLILAQRVHHLVDILWAPICAACVYFS